MPISLTYLRANLYKIVDQILASGVPVEIERHGLKVRIMPISPHDKLSRLKKRTQVVNGNSDELVHFDWSSHWNEEKNL